MTKLIVKIISACSIAAVLGVAITHFIPQQPISTILCIIVGGIWGGFAADWIRRTS